MAPPQVLSRRPDTPSPHARDTGRTTTRLPTELLAEQAHRLTVFNTVAVALWSFALLSDLVRLPAASSNWSRNWRIIPIECVGALGSALLWWYFRRSDTTL